MLINSANKRVLGLPNNTISTSTDRANRRDILSGNFEEIAIDIVLNIASTMSWYSSDVVVFS